MTPTAIMIFAAGRGTRMGELTRDRPKPLIEVSGRALIDHTLDLTSGRSLKRVVNVHHHADTLCGHLGGKDLLISDETEALLETGGGLRKAIPLLGDGPVFTLNSDAIWSGPNPLDILLSCWDSSRMDALLLLLAKENAIGHLGTGDFLRGSDGRLTRGPGLIYSGAQIIDPTGLNAIPEAAFSLNRLWDAQLSLGRVYGVVYDGQWCDVGTPEGITLAEALLEGTDVRPDT